jgi:hypothetical protein
MLLYVGLGAMFVGLDVMLTSLILKWRETYVLSAAM